MQDNMESKDKYSKENMQSKEKMTDSSQLVIYRASFASAPSSGKLT